MDIADLAYQVGRKSRASRREDMKRNIGMGMLDQVLAQNPAALGALTGQQRPAPANPWLDTRANRFGGGGGGVGGGGGSSSPAPGDGFYRGSGEPFIDRRAEGRADLAAQVAVDQRYANVRMQELEESRAKYDFDRTKKLDKIRDDQNLYERMKDTEAALGGQVGPTRQALLDRIATGGRLPRGGVVAVGATAGKRGGPTDAQLANQAAGLLKQANAAKDPVERAQIMEAANLMLNKIKESMAPAAEVQPEAGPSYIKTGDTSFTNDPAKIAAAQERAKVLMAQRIQAKPPAGPTQFAVGHDQAPGSVPIKAGVTGQTGLTDGGQYQIGIGTAAERNVAGTGMGTAAELAMAGVRAPVGGAPQKVTQGNVRVPPPALAVGERGMQMVGAIGGGKADALLDAWDKEGKPNSGKSIKEQKADMVEQQEQANPQKVAQGNAMVSPPALAVQGEPGIRGPGANPVDLARSLQRQQEEKKNKKKGKDGGK